MPKSSVLLLAIRQMLYNRTVRNPAGSSSARTPSLELSIISSVMGTAAA